MMKLLAKLLPGCAILAVALATGAAADGIPAEGKIIAERWCAACHQVSPEQPTASADVPSFMTIAGRLGDEEAEEKLARFLADPHPIMPDMNLSRQEAANLVAYIAGLR